MLMGCSAGLAEVLEIQNRGRCMLLDGRIIASHTATTFLLLPGLLKMLDFQTVQIPANLWKSNPWIPIKDAFSAGKFIELSVTASLCLVAKGPTQPDTLSQIWLTPSNASRAPAGISANQVTMV